VSRAFLYRLPLLVAVAFIASALADPVVESVSNTGIFGGHYADNNHIGIIPALLVGLVLVLEVLTLRFMDLWRHAANGSRGRRVDDAKDFAAAPVARDIPAVLVMQLAALFLLESAEQVALGGRLLGGTAWLGGPILFSLLTHALIGAGCIFVLGVFMRAMTRTFASIVRSAIRFIWLAIAGTTGEFNRDRRDTPGPRAQAPHVRQIGGRAPPLLRTPGLSYIS
jgi:hypothetical protein